YQIEINQTDKEVQITIKANDFLHNMARMIVSTLLDIGIGMREPEDIYKIFDKDSDMVGSFNVEAQGLFLKEVEY
ncbi:MAG TPA: tRNA pseudouridine synthase A, partial [Clostridiales bacterium]|nr:tRNA pseudouridine synthase A [Clostridiales bacterium]